MGEAIVSIRGPLERVDGEFCLRIPLAAGGEALRPVCAGISREDGAMLRGVLPEWLVEKLGLREGCTVHVDNGNGKFNIRLWEGDGEVSGGELQGGSD